MNRRTATSTCNILIAACAVFVFSKSNPVMADPRIGQPAPALVATELDSQQFDLSTERGHVVIVSFWATWCGPCRQEMPELDAFYHLHHADGVDMIALSLDSPHDTGDVRKTMQPFTYPAGLLRDCKTNGFGQPRQLPVTYVIGPDGTIQAEFRGGKPAVTNQALEAIVRKFLAVGKA